MPFSLAGRAFSVYCVRVPREHLVVWVRVLIRLNTGALNVLRLSERSTPEVNRPLYSLASPGALEHCAFIGEWVKEMQ